MNVDFHVDTKIPTETRPAIVICPNCNEPNYFRTSRLQYPAPMEGQPVQGLPKEIKLLYDEARACTQVGAYTSCIMACRKLLMHIAVEVGADTGLKFVQYVEYLADQGYVPPNGKEWVDRIRTRGNQASHEIVIMTRDDAQELLFFVQMLLTFIYEFPTRGKRSTAS